MSCLSTSPPPLRDWESMRGGSLRALSLSPEPGSGPAAGRAESLLLNRCASDERAKVQGVLLKEALQEGEGSSGGLGRDGASCLPPA